MPLKTIGKFLLLIATIYVFILSIQLMGVAFKLMGEGFAQALIKTTSNPIVGLLIGVLVTSIIQSSSTTTSITVGFVAGGVLTLQGAIPIIMGANIGTTITSAIVSMGHVTRKHEFQRAFAAATVHEFFNIITVVILFPIEMTTHILEKTATVLSNTFVGIGGIQFLSPLKLITKPIIDYATRLISIPILITILALVLLFFALVNIVKIMRSLVLGKIEVFLDKYLFKNDLTAFLLALFVTAVIQSSSITTSLIVPLVGAGLLTVRKIFPYTLGANVGTTVTAMLAAFATLNPIAITVAFTHFLFNVFGIIIVYPFKSIPIWLAENFSKITAKSKKNTLVFLIIYFLLYLSPLVYFLFFK
ncbi:MAG: Na/Pi symporter [Candidatus Aminicenantes bacterium]|nr:Na/Pi symporter [Candidatus Aminicenantes bacterium]